MFEHSEDQILLPCRPSDPFDAVSGEHDQFMFALGFRAALRVCEIANERIDEAFVDCGTEG